MRRLEDETRLKEKRCQGEGIDYVPWIKVREVSSNGTSSIITNWKNDRRCHLLSVAEYDVFHIENFREDVLDIREQYALLDTDLVNTIAKRKSFSKPRGYLSTDLLLTTNTGVGKEAISIKASRSQIENKTRDLEKLIIEKEYWKSKNVPWRLIFGEDINKTIVRNIALCAEIYKLDFIEDDVQALKYMIIHRYIEPDLSKDFLDFSQLLKTYRKELKILYEYTSKQDRPYRIRSNRSEENFRQHNRNWDALYQIR